MKGLVALPTVKQKEDLRHVFYAFAQERVTISDTLCSPLSNLSAMPGRALENENRPPRAASLSSARARGIRHSSVGKTALLPPLSHMLQPHQSQHGAEMPLTQGRTDPNYFPFLPKQSRNEGVNHSFDLQFEACLFPRALRKSHVKSITES